MLSMFMNRNEITALGIEWNILQFFTFSLPREVTFNSAVAISQWWLGLQLLSTCKAGALELDVIGSSAQRQVTGLFQSFPPTMRSHALTCAHIRVKNGERRVECGCGVHRQ